MPAMECGHCRASSAAGPGLETPYHITFGKDGEIGLEKCAH